MDDLTGRTLGPYELHDRIGSGGMATVYRGVHRTRGYARAVKVLLPSMSADASIVERFRAEATIAASLRHPNIVPIYGVDEEDGYFYLVMELVAGISLGRLLRRDGPLEFPRAMHVLRQLASAIDYAHGRGVLHRDVKSANVLMGPGDHVTLFDFGIARAVATLTRLTKPGLMVGTPQYLAPEVISGGEADRSADLYALGTLAYEIIAGQVPFDGLDPMAVLYAQVTRQPPWPRDFRHDLPAPAEHVLLRQLSKTPSERFATAGAFVNALGSALGSVEDAEPERPAPPRPAHRVLLDTSETDATASQPDDETPTPRPIARPVSPPPPVTRRLPAAPPAPTPRPPPLDAEGTTTPREPPLPSDALGLARADPAGESGQPVTPVTLSVMRVLRQPRRDGDRLLRVIAVVGLVGLLGLGIVWLGPVLRTGGVPGWPSRAPTPTGTAASSPARPSPTVPVAAGAAASPPVVAAQPTPPPRGTPPPTASPAPAVPPVPTIAPTAPPPAPAPEQQLAAALASIEAGDPASALASLRALKEAAPDTPGLDDALVRAHLAYGQQLLDQGLLDEGEAEIAAALALRPDDPPVLEAQKQLALARLWATMEAAWDHDDGVATAALEEILALDPGYRDANVKLYALLVAEGERRLAAGDRDGARVLFERAHAVYPDGDEARMRLEGLSTPS